MENNRLCFTDSQLVWQALLCLHDAHNFCVLFSHPRGREMLPFGTLIPELAATPTSKPEPEPEPQPQTLDDRSKPRMVPLPQKSTF